MFIRASRETHSGELVLVVRPNVYIGDDATDPEPDFVYNPDTHDIASTLPPGSDPLVGSIMLLSESLESGAALAQFEVRNDLAFCGATDYPLLGSIMLLSESLESGAALAQFEASRRPIENQTLKNLTLEWPWPWPWDDLDIIYDSDLRQVIYDFDLRQVKLLNWCPGRQISIFKLWPWHLPNDFDTQTWLRYGHDVPPYVQWSFYFKNFESYSPSRQTQAHGCTDTLYKNITFCAYVLGIIFCVKTVNSEDDTFKLDLHAFNDNFSWTTQRCMYFSILQQMYRKKPGLTHNAARATDNICKNRYRDISPCKSIV